MKKVVIICLLGVLMFFAAGVNGYGRKDKDDECEMEKDEGTCKEKKDRFYFDKKMKCCRHFYHKGCRKNNNNFHSRHDCYKKCGGHTERKSDFETEYHRMEIKMESPITFYKAHGDEYTKNFKEAVAIELPISTTEINILKVYSGSTVIIVEIKRSFNDDSLKKFIYKIKAGKFSFTVAGKIVKSVHGQDVKHKQLEGDLHRRWRLRKLALIIVPIVSLIGICIAVIVAIKVMKHKNVKSGPIETSDDTFQTTWKNSYPDSISMEKKTPPTDFVTADDAICPPSYNSATSPPPSYTSRASLRGATAEENHPTNASEDVSA